MRIQYQFTYKKIIDNEVYHETFQKYPLCDRPQGGQ
jgi:hypothetical protein